MRWWFRKATEGDASVGKGYRSKVIRQEEMVYGDLVERPYDLEVLKVLYEQSAVFSSVCMQIASDVAGSGWRLVLKEGASESVDELRVANEFLDNPSDGISLRELIYRVILDWGVFGYSGIEVVRDLGGRIVKIYHVPADTLYVTKAGLYAQVVANNRVYFKPFNDDRVISAVTGEEGDVPLEERANELIFFKRYSPGQSTYGVPCIVPALKGLMTLIGIHDFNYAFFENLGIPAYVVKLKGTWRKASVDTIRDFFDEKLKGAENAHRTLVLTLPYPDGEADFQEVGGNKFEGSFMQLFELLRDEILMSYSMPPHRVGLSKSSSASYTEASRIYNTKVVEPLQQDIQMIINNCLATRGVTSYRFLLAHLDLKDFASEVRSYTELLKLGVLTPNEVRNKLDLGEPYIGGDVHFRAYRTVVIPDKEREFEVERIEEL